jgi:hypothetical protein
MVRTSTRRIDYDKKCARSRGAATGEEVMKHHVTHEICVDVY